MSNVPVIWIGVLHEAAKRNMIERIDQALAQGVPVDAPDGEGVTALVRAVEQVHEEATQHLLARGATPTGHVWREALDRKHYPLIDLLLESGSPLPDNLSTVLRREVKWARSKHCPPLGTNTWYQDETADILNAILLYAGPEMYLYLLRHPLIEQRGLLTPCVLDSGLLCASYMGITEVMEPLLDMGADVNAATGYQGRTALHFAASAGCWREVKILLERGADVDRPSSDGSTPLLMATLHNKRRIAWYLLQSGADIRPKAFGGQDAEALATTNKMDRVLQEIQRRKYVS
jgi:ankyrin repeat protein